MHYQAVQTCSALPLFRIVSAPNFSCKVSWQVLSSFSRDENYTSWDPLLQRLGSQSIGISRLQSFLPGRQVTKALPFPSLRSLLCLFLFFLSFPHPLSLLPSFSFFFSRKGSQRAKYTLDFTM